MALPAAALLTVALTVALGGAAADDAKLAAYGKHLAQECTSCHRIDGINNGIPSIVGWPHDMFTTTMRFYKDGARANPVMVSVAGSLNDEQIKALATYFGSLPKPSPRASPPAADKKTRK
jgi:cytochrome c553